MIRPQPQPRAGGDHVGSGSAYRSVAARGNLDSERLDHELLREQALVGPQRGAHRQLARPAVHLGEHQRGHVGTCDEEARVLVEKYAGLVSGVQ